MARIDWEDGEGQEHPAYQDPDTTTGSPDQHPYYTDAPAPTAPSGGGNNDPLAGYSETERDFLRRNQNADGSYDTHRLASAMASNNTSSQGREYDSQGPMYDQRTNQLRAGITAKQTGASSGYSAPNLPGNQFGNDPYSQMLESVAKGQMGAIQSNPALDKLLAFLDTRFTELSTNPGYSPQEQALLRTQALDPIEADRSASQRRSLERTARNGWLPSSGLHELDSREVDATYDRMRGGVQRDLGINAINKRNQDLGQALAVGQMAGVQIPGQQRGETLNLANLLYNMPRQSMYDALAVVNGSPAPGDQFGNAVQMYQQQQNQQALNDQRNREFWASMGELFGNLFD